jgi:hypothetical protein
VYCIIVRVFDPSRISFPYHLDVHEAGYAYNHTLEAVPHPCLSVPFQEVRISELDKQRNHVIQCSEMLEDLTLNCV